MMQFTRAFASLVLIALTVVEAAPGLRTSLTKRWCGFAIDCPCNFNPKRGCVPVLDEDEKQWYWPPTCKGCGECLELCVDPSELIARRVG
ncbi:hypothetical protein DFH09DRAFT_1312720 [Mycena vulgaris]|nr:hypothetical protein DFH09DRAFT_1312720 [Mycena vulgaris]